MTKELIDAVKREISNDFDFEDALKQWFKKKGNLPPDEVNLEWDDWLKVKIEYAASCVPSHLVATPSLVAEILRIDSVGDPIANRLARDVKSRGFLTDTNCYVEDGVVYSNVWMEDTIGRAENTGVESERAKRVYEDAGYAVDIWVDEENYSEHTVNASIDLETYCMNRGFDVVKIKH